MNDIANSKIDLIWMFAADEYVKDLIRESRVPHPDAVMDKITEARILRMIRKDHHRQKRRQAWKIVRVALVACLILATLALAACVAIPTIREAIWKVVLEWGDESVKINFVPSDDPDYTNPSVTTTDQPSDGPTTTTTTTKPTDEPEPPVVEAPTSIKEVNIPSYVPSGYTVQSSASRKVYMVTYYDSEGNVAATFQQMTISSGSEGDSQEGVSTDIIINGLNAVLITYEDHPDLYVLYWQDSQYRYNISGTFESQDEVLRIANSVVVK
jgi:cytoskeletal protein RodZ